MPGAVEGIAALAAVIAITSGALRRAPVSWRPGGRHRPGPHPRRKAPLSAPDDATRPPPGPRWWATIGVPRSGRRATGPRPAAARWADRTALRRLVVDGPRAGRLTIGTVVGPRRRGGQALLAAEPAQSVAVVGPTQSGKTTGLAVPAILSWEGPVMAASVKADLLADTVNWRRRCGRVWCFDPAGATGLPASSWSPLPAARTWPGARRVAADLTEVARGTGTTADGEFWYATAAKLLAPLLFAAAAAGATMADVLRWVDTQEVDEVLDLLLAAGVPEAVRAARATWQRDERQRSAVYTTAETVLEPFADTLPHPAVPVPGVPWQAAGLDATPPQGMPAVRSDAPARSPGPYQDDVDPQLLLTGAHTLYVCAPAHDQRRLRGLFVALVKQVLEAAFDRAVRGGRPLAPPLLVVLDEAANIAPLAELDAVAATCAGHGVQLVTVWQDLAQVRARYGERAATVVNNHRAKLFLSGTSDPSTLDHASHLAGEEEVVSSSVSRSAWGERTVTTAPQQRRLLPPDALRRLSAGTGILVYGSLPPVQVALRPWFEDPLLARRAGKGSSADHSAGTRRWPRMTSGTAGSRRRARRRGRRSRRGGRRH